MPPRRRKSAFPSPSSTTMTTPITRSTTGKSNATTPFTSEPEPDSDLDDSPSNAGVRKTRQSRPRLSRLNSSRKRLRGSSEEEEGGEDEILLTPSKVAKPVMKRRALENRAYVEVPSRNEVATAQTRSAVPSDVEEIVEDGEEVAKTPPPTTQSDRKKPALSAKAKGKQKAPIVYLSDDAEDEEIVHESDSSGSEFQGSDAGPEAGDKSSTSEEDEEEAQLRETDEESDSIPTRRSRTKAKSRVVVKGDQDLDEIMLNAAIQQSLKTEDNDEANINDYGQLVGANAFKCIITTIADYAASSDLSELDSDDSDAPLMKKKGKGRKRVKVETDDEELEDYKISELTPDQILIRQMILDSRVRLTRKEKKDLACGRNYNKLEEKATAQNLGRRLTHAEKTTISLYTHHPTLRTVWKELESQPVPETAEKAPQPAGLKVKLLPFQQESLHWMREQENGLWKGGILADEMGMGKTIQTLALLVSDRRKPNLVIAPTVAIMQWKNEIEAHTTGMKINVFHGQSRSKDIEELQSADIVLTTYAVLESCYRKQTWGFRRKGVMQKEDSPLHKFKWARVILDEAHNIKERSTGTAKGAFELQAQYKWCLSGTPLQNRVGELYSLIRFFQADPFAYYFCKRCPCKSLHWRFKKDRSKCDECGHTPMHHVCLWNNEILGPIQKNAFVGAGKDAFRKLRILLSKVMLRRTKLERADDLGLPPRTVIVRRDYFSPEEAELYKSLFSDAKRTFSTYVDSGTLLNNYSNIFSLITRMRQMACHPDLVLKSKTNPHLSADIVESTVCRLCNDIAEDAIESKCHHIFDRECIRQYMETTASVGNENPECPVCHVRLTIDLEGEAIELSEDVVNKAKQGILGRLDLDSWRSSSKIEALVEELSELRRGDCTTKSIVFSQFVNFLDLIAFRLKKAGFNICRLEGTMSPQARDLTIKHFMNNVDVTVFLVSLKAGGVALNLTEASRVYLMDSWWNPAVEYQAMDRIHRLGQHRPVQAIKLVIEDSIESRIVQLQEKKSAMVDATLSTDDSAMGRLTPEDLSFLFKM